MSETKPPSCQTCRWWDMMLLNPLPSDRGACRINSPLAGYGFPYTYPKDWCGEYEQKVEAPADVSK